MFDEVLTSLEAGGGAVGEDFSGAFAVIRHGAAGELVNNQRRSQYSLGTVSGGFDAWEVQECKQPLSVFAQPICDPLLVRV